MAAPLVPRAAFEVAPGANVAEITQCPQCQRKLNVPDAQLGQTVKCPLCGEEFTAAVLHIQRAPTSLPVPQREPLPPRRDDYRPRPIVDDDYRSPYGGIQAHRAGAVFAVGLIGLLTSFCVLPGWIMGGMAVSMGAADLQQMARGGMDDSGRALTKGGQLCGIAALVISTLTFLAFCLINGRL